MSSSSTNKNFVVDTSQSIDSWQGIQIIVDIGWGDAGKGKLVDVLAQDADMVIRYAGGDNAGHTVKNDQGTFKFGLIPSGICSNALCILERGVAINPFTLAKEITDLANKGFAITSDKLLISQDAHLIMPWHKERDRLSEKARGEEKIGTTGRGIGPTYADRTERVGLRVGDLLLPQKEFEAKFDRELNFQERLVRMMSGSKPLSERDDIQEPIFNRDEILTQLKDAKRVFGTMVTDATARVWKYYQEGKKILGEGAQGILLDIDQGTYPFVTSSNPGVVGFERSTGISARRINQVSGVTRAYTARVGTGAFPTELKEATGELIRKRGNEYGTQTGRPRRCGWFDAVALSFGAQRGDIDTIAITKLDILDVFETIKICVSYRDMKTGKEYHPGMMTDMSDLFLARMEAIYEEMDGWNSDTTHITSFTKLPPNAQTYIKKISKLLRKPIGFVSVGPDRTQSFFIKSERK